MSCDSRQGIIRQAKGAYTDTVTLTGLNGRYYSASGYISTTKTNAWGNAYINSKGGNVPAGHMGLSVRVFDTKTKQALDATGWDYNKSALAGY